MADTSGWEKIGWGVAVVFTFAFFPLGSLELITVNSLSIMLTIVGLVMGFCCTDNKKSHSLIFALSAAVALTVLSLIPIYLVGSIWFANGAIADAYWTQMLLANLSFALGALVRWVYEQRFIRKNHLR